MPTRKPLLIITGFLGAGKTTLVRTLLAEFVREELKASVILNDIGSADLDAATILSPAAESITPIAASCACCESLDELVSAGEKAVRGKNDLLLIELNGTGDPLELLGAITLLDERLPFSPKLLVCVIDVRHWGRRGELTPLEKRQMQGAGLYILSHTDCANRDEINRIETTLSEEFPDSRQITAKRLAEFLTTGSAFLAKSDQGLMQDYRAHRDPIGKQEHDEIHLLSHQIEGFQIPLPPKVRRASIERLLSLLPNEVLRAKALVKIVEEPGVRWLFERSGTELSPSPIPISGITAPSSLLCTGMRLNPDTIRKLVSKAFGYVPVPQNTGLSRI